MFQSFVNFISSVAIALVAVFGINLGTKEPRYDIEDRIGGNVEIRHYRARVAAETTVDVGKSDNARREAFMRIAGYIFGANQSRQKIDMTSPVEVKSTGEKIKMTAPVEVNESQGQIVMRFFMPSNYTKAELPEPTDSWVKLVEIPPATVAALRFSGSSNPSVVADRTNELANAIKSTKWKSSGPSSAYFYNPPWTIPFLRHNEVVIPVASEHK